MIHTCVIFFLETMLEQILLLCNLFWQYEFIALEALLVAVMMVSIRARIIMIAFVAKIVMLVAWIGLQLPILHKLVQEVDSIIVSICAPLRTLSIILVAQNFNAAFS